MNKARVVEPYLIGKSMSNEVEHGFQVPLVDGSFHTGFLSKKSQQVSEGHNGTWDNAQYCGRILQTIYHFNGYWCGWDQCRYL
jgi:hypothetical protein